MKLMTAPPSTKPTMHVVEEPRPDEGHPGVVLRSMIARQETTLVMVLVGDRRDALRGSPICS